jgi:hypothetical protein
MTEQPAEEIEQSGDAGLRQVGHGQASDQRRSVAPERRVSSPSGGSGHRSNEAITRSRCE